MIGRFQENSSNDSNPNEKDIELLDALLLEWEEARDRGDDISVKRLCRECPRLIPEMQRRIQALLSMDSVFDTGAGGSTWHLADAAAREQKEQGLAESLPEIPGYEIEGKIGQGGMGVVYRAKQLGLCRTVALKMIIRGEHAGAEQMARFRLEAETVAKLQHSNIVQIHETGEHAGLPYFSLEFVDGGTLADMFSRSTQTPREAARLTEIIARALHAAHEREIVHRDLKPGNVLLTSTGVPKVVDFGLAKQVDTDSSHTQTGSILGTPSYMAPEQANGRGDLICPATDVYALGAILYEALTGRPPFRAATALETLDEVRNAEPVSPRVLQAKVPRDLETITLHCLAKRPEHRYESAEELADDLCRYLHEEPILARPIGIGERAIKFSRRRPATVAMIAIISLALSLVFAMGAVYNSRLQTQQTHLTTANSKLQQKSNELEVLNESLVTEMDKNKRLLTLSYVAYGRTCALASKIAHQDDSVFVESSRQAVVGGQYLRQFQLQCELLIVADPEVKPVLDAFRKALQGWDGKSESKTLKRLSLKLAETCGASWSRATKDSPELQECIRKNLYLRASAAVERLANANRLIDVQHDYVDFWELYWGELAIVESDEMASLMVRFGDLVKRWRAKGWDVPPGDLRSELRQAARDLQSSVSGQIEMTIPFHPHK